MTRLEQPCSECPASYQCLNYGKEPDPKNPGGRFLIKVWFECDKVVPAIEALSNAIVNAPETPMVWPRCSGCGNEIDPDCCHCGDPMSSHLGLSHNHSPVPMGCQCGREKTL